VRFLLENSNNFPERGYVPTPVGAPPRPLDFLFFSDNSHSGVDLLFRDTVYYLLYITEVQEQYAKLVTPEDLHLQSWTWVTFNDPTRSDPWMDRTHVQLCLQQLTDDRIL